MLGMAEAHEANAAAAAAARRRKVAFIAKANV